MNENRKSERMCAVSAIGDVYTKRFQEWNNHIWTDPNSAGYNPNNPNFVINPTPSSDAILIYKKEFEELKKTVLEMKEVLIAAKLYDDRTNQPHCEQEEKVALLKKVAEFVGIDLDEVFGKDKQLD